MEYLAQENKAVCDGPEFSNFEPLTEYDPERERERDTEEFWRDMENEAMMKHKTMMIEAPEYVRLFDRLRRKHSQAR